MYLYQISDLICSLSILALFYTAIPSRNLDATAAHLTETHAIVFYTLIPVHKYQFTIVTMLFARRFYDYFRFYTHHCCASTSKWIGKNGH